MKQNHPILSLLVLTLAVPFLVSCERAPQDTEMIGREFQALDRQFVAAMAQQLRKPMFLDSATHDFTEGPLTVWGNRGEGPSGAFVRFAPGNPDSARLHAHTNDTRVIGIRGAYIYRSQDGTEIRVGPGQYLFIPGGVPHFSFGDRNEGALFYEESLARFDSYAVGR